MKKKESRTDRLETPVIGEFRGEEIEDIKKKIRPESKECLFVVLGNEPTELISRVSALFHTDT